ncbi:hypothetical protein EDB89DRAFT_1942890 [Lactarius sanguifluus]|nr:hypothetical protein EDB89DRAFT_1942890 [Lactarius sanguifluus]
MPTKWQNGEIDGTTWHELLRSFIGVKILHICGALSKELSRALEMGGIGSDPGLLPGLQELAGGELYVNSWFDSFIHARRVAGRPIRLSSLSNFQTIFDEALKAYKRKTKKDLLAHPLSAQLQSCDSPSDVIAVLHNMVNEFDQSSTHDERLSRWLDPTINVLYALSAALGHGVRLTFSPAKVIFAGAGDLLLASKDVDRSQETLVDLFERIENFFRRLEPYTEVPPTAAMTDMTVNIMIEVLNIFAIATKEMRLGRAKKFFMKLVGRTDMEDALMRLDRLTQEEARMAVAEVLRIAHSVRDEVKVVDV